MTTLASAGRIAGLVSARRVPSRLAGVLAVALLLAPADAAGTPSDTLALSQTSARADDVVAASGTSSVPTIEVDFAQAERVERVGMAQARRDGTWTLDVRVPTWATAGRAEIRAWFANPCEQCGQGGATAALEIRADGDDSPRPLSGAAPAGSSAGRRGQLGLLAGVGCLACLSIVIALRGRRARGRVRAVDPQITR
jgi:hypothetical protein